MIVTQPVVYVTGRTVTGRGKIQVSGGEPLHPEKPYPLSAMMMQNFAVGVSTARLAAAVVYLRV
ncbi:hypothetical protein CRR48_22905 [Salmonella enterica]|nr:hypothetical protein [Salmonella enterica]